MFELLPRSGALAAFLFTTFVLAVTPGPGVVYIVTRTLAQGRGAGLASAAGVALGNFGNAVGASLGLAALFAVSVMAFTVLKFSGAAYLVYLGVQAMRRPRTVVGVPYVPAVADHARIFRDGFLVALLNPKTSIFFAAFLPQFIHADISPIFQSVALSLAFVLIAAATDSAYVLMSGVLAPLLRTGGTKASAYGRYLAAGVYFGLGIYSALAQYRGARVPGP